MLRLSSITPHPGWRNCNAWEVLTGPQRYRPEVPGEGKGVLMGAAENGSVQPIDRGMFQDRSLALAPGLRRWDPWIGIAAGLFFTVMASLLAFLLPPGSNGWVIVGLWATAIFSAAVVALMIPRALTSRQPQVLEVDERGIRLLRGGTVERELPWGEIRGVRYGVRQITGGRYQFRRFGYSLHVGGQRPWRFIDIDDVNYAVPRESLVAMAERIVGMARARSISTKPYQASAAV